MNIALIGYGKMGHAIEGLATEHGHQITTTIDNPEEWAARADAVRRSDVAIEFTMPQVAVDNIRRCFDLHVPMVVGTTGWYAELDAVVERCRAEEQSLFVASNFSIGMNIMFDLNRRLAHLMNRYTDYDVAISETHHIHKLDAPSGTAISLANDIVREVDRKRGWQLVEGDSTVADGAIAISATREGEVAGVHEVVYDSAIDTIRVSHSAKSRMGLAQGALLAAEYLMDHPGYHTMQDLLSM